MNKYLRQVINYFKTLGRFIGPGFMIAVGYLDPGNWATDMEGGSSFGYRLLFIILISNLIAVFLQNLTIRLGTISNMDLASASRKLLPRWLNIFLYILAEIAIIACDIAEVIGSAIALNLLFPALPLPAGVAITAVDVFIILLFYNDEEQQSAESNENSSHSQKTIRFFEMFVMLLVAAVGICFIIELVYSDIVAVDVFKGFLPTKEIFTQPDILYVAIGIIGATVMPHNLYLHSFVVQARCKEWRQQRPKVIKTNSVWVVKRNSPHEKNEQLEFNHLETVPISTNNVNDKELSSATLASLLPPTTGVQQPHHTQVAIDEVIIDDIDQCGMSTITTEHHTINDNGALDFNKISKSLDSAVKRNLHYGLVDLVVALTFAFFVNCAILIVASANFYYGPNGNGNGAVVQDLFSAHALLMQYLGPPAAVTFALALLCAGQSSTLTATLAGQVVMSGFLGMTTRPWVRRIVTRLIAITPAMIAACVAGRDGLSNMLVASQVALSIQLPFAVVPLVYFTSTKRAMKIDLVVETQANVMTEKDIKKTITGQQQPPLTWLDRLVLKLRQQQQKKQTHEQFQRNVSGEKTSVWFYLRSFNVKAIKDYCLKPNQHNAPAVTDSTGVGDCPVQQDVCELRTDGMEEMEKWPEPLTYTNNLCVKIVAVGISLLLIGLNAYLVISLFLQI